MGTDSFLARLPPNLFNHSRIDGHLGCLGLSALRNN